MMSIFNKLYILLAQTIPVGDGGVDIPQKTATEVLADTLNLVYFSVGIVAVIVIIISGYTFATSSDPTKIAQARNTILYTAVGLVVIVAAFFITQFVIRAL